MKIVAFISFFIFATISVHSKVFIPFVANGEFDYYVPPNECCAIISAYLGIYKLGMKTSNLRDVEECFMQIRKPPYSLLDITAVLEEFNINSRALKLRKREYIFTSNFAHLIIFLSSPGGNIGHFSFCFRGKDGRYWVADPSYGNKCIEFTLDSEIFRLFTGIVLVLEKNSDSV